MMPDSIGFLFVHVVFSQCAWLAQVYIDGDGRMLSGSKAYEKSQRDKSSGTQSAGNRRKIRKSPSKGKRKRKSKTKAKGSKLPKFRATKSRFG